MDTIEDLVEHIADQVELWRDKGECSSEMGNTTVTKDVSTWDIATQTVKVDLTHYEGESVPFCRMQHDLRAEDGIYVGITISLARFDHKNKTAVFEIELD